MLVLTNNKWLTVVLIISQILAIVGFLFRQFLALKEAWKVGKLAYSTYKNTLKLIRIIEIKKELEKLGKK